MAAAKKKVSEPEVVSTASTTSSSASIDANTAKLLAAVSYIFPLIGIILYFLFKKGENDLVRFHSLQSVLLGVVFFVIFFFGIMITTVLSIIIGIIPIIGAIIGLLIGLVAFFVFGGLSLVYLVVAIFCLMKVLKDEKKKLPIIGNLAEKYS